MSKYPDSVISLYTEIEEKVIDKAEKLFISDMTDDSLFFKSASTGEIYKTDLTSCSCPQFQKRHLVCKHMVRLAMERNIPITYLKPHITYSLHLYGTDELLSPEPVASASAAPVDAQPASSDPIARDYAEAELMDILSSLGIAVEDKRSAGGCLWIENTRQHEQFLSKLTVDGKPLIRTKPASHFKWLFAWYLK